MIHPVRIQRSRQHKQESPNGLPIVYVGRPSKWGNPLKLPWVSDEEAARKTLVLEHEKWLLRGDLKIKIEDIKKELKGKNLSCWCRLDEPCHADVLLKIANEE